MNDIEPELKKLTEMVPCDLGPNVQPGKDPEFDKIAGKMGTEGLGIDEFMDFLHRMNDQDPDRGLPRDAREDSRSAAAHTDNG